MKILPFTIPKTDKNFLIYQEDIEVKFYNKFHRHEEIQLSYIEKGHGTLIVGDTINDFREGDIILLGSNVPHLFKNDILEKKSKMISLFFSHDKSQQSPFDIEDLKELKLFLMNSDNGNRFTNVDDELKQLFEGLKTNSSVNRFLNFISILNALVKYKPIPLSTYNKRKPFSTIQELRMRRVMDYSISNFKHDIPLMEISKVANLTKHSFCKYFKHHTNRSYTQFLNELRINHAAKLLLSSKEYIMIEIAERSGFNNLSYFNRQFKSLKGLSPTDFRKKYMK